MVKKEPNDSLEATPETKKRVEYDDLYRRSTQYTIWSFTKEELQQRRIEVNKRGSQVAKEKSEKVKNPHTGEIEKVDVKFLTIEEELKIIAYYARKANGLSNLFKMPSQVRGTAISFLKKFYLHHSTMEYHPKNIMLTCLFLAAKAENYFISVKTFAGKINNTAIENILKYEYLIIQTLQFTLMVHHPFRSLYGFYLDIQTVLPKVDKNRIGKSYDRTRDAINESLISDVGFFFTPPQIALSCWRKVDKELIDRYLKKKYPTKTTNTLSIIKEENEEEDSVSPPELKEEEDLQMSKLLKVLDECESLCDTGYDPNIEESKIIDKKVHYCITPSKVFKRKRDEASATPLSADTLESKKPKIN